MLVVIQARMASTRLPGKSLLDLGGRPVVAWVLRAAHASRAGRVVVAIPAGAADDPLVEVAHAGGADVVRGHPTDVLARFISVLDLWGEQPVVRLTADCPLLDPDVIRTAAGAFTAGKVDYLSTIAPRSLPRGLDVEVAAASALRQADAEAVGYHRAHVTSWIRDRADRFRIAGLVFQPPAADLRVTLDTAEDHAALQAIVAELGDEPPSWRDVAALLRRRPDIVALNADVRQKPIEAG